MKKFMLTLDLQLFAGGTSVEIEGETYEIDHEVDTEIEVETEETDESEEESDASDDADDSSDDETEVEEAQEEVKEKNPTANAVIAERKKWQAKLEEAQKKAALADKIMSQAGVKDLTEFQRHVDALEAQKLINDGVDPQQAQFFVQQQREMADMKRQLMKQQHDVQIQSMKLNPFYSDVDDYRDELEDMATRSNMTLEQAYMALRGAERIKEYETQIEQRIVANQQKKQARKVDTSASGNTKPKTKSTLTDDEKSIARAAGMSYEDYEKYKKR